MPKAGLGLIRVIAATLMLAQAGAYALSPWAEARAGGGASAVTTIEAGHSDACVIVHRPDTCLACQLLSLRYGAALGSTHVPQATDTGVAACIATGVAGPGSSLAVPHDSRGPPPTTA